MIRAIIKCKYKNQVNGYEGESFETLDFDAPTLELHLTGGGSSEDGYEIYELIGVEILSKEGAHND